MWAGIFQKTKALNSNACVYNVCKCSNFLKRKHNKAKTITKRAKNVQKQAT